MNKKHIEKLQLRLVLANNQLLAELEKQFPLHALVFFNIMYGQVNPSRGHVIGYSGGPHAYLRVRLISKTNNVRDVPASEIQHVIFRE